MNKKKIFVILGLLVLILISVVIFLVIDKKNQILHITFKDLTISFLEEKKISDFIDTIEGEVLEDKKVDSSSIGEKTITFQYVNEKKKKGSYSFKINVVDKEPPLFFVQNSYTVIKGSSFNLSKVLCGDNEDPTPNCFIDGTFDTEVLGTYPLAFRAIDRSNNEKKMDFTLNVIEQSPNMEPKPTKTPTKTLFSDIVNNHKTSSTQIGLDVSGWQGDIDFEKIKNAGVEFMMIKVGGTKGTNEEYYLDSKFIRNITEAQKYNIPVGIYFYSYANSIEGSKKDALWVIEQLKDYKIDLPIAFDWENWSDYNQYQLSFYGLSEMANIFLKTIEEHGYKGMLYSSKSYLEKIWLPTSYKTWLAHYTDKTNYQKDYYIWQMCSDGLIDGIDGFVDINILYQ